MSSDDNEERVLKRLTVRELRQKAVKALGAKVAAGLKLKQELVEALVEKAEKAAKAVKAKAAPKKSPPRKSPPKAAKKAAAPAKRPTPPRMSTPAAKPSKAEVVAEVYELPITRDFFVDPRRPALPAAYGDDRLLCFRREPLAIVVSWDLSSSTFTDGQGLSLELVTHRGQLVGSKPVHAPTGLATFVELPEGKALTVQVVRRGRVMTRGRPFILGTVRDDEGGAWQMTVPLDQPMSASPERELWADAPATAARAGGPRASSSRLSS